MAEVLVKVVEDVVTEGPVEEVVEKDEETAAFEDDAAVAELEVALEEEEAAAEEELAAALGIEKSPTKPILMLVTSKMV